MHAIKTVPPKPKHTTSTVHGPIEFDEAGVYETDDPAIIKLFKGQPAGFEVVKVAPPEESGDGKADPKKPGRPPKEKPETTSGDPADAKTGNDSASKAADAEKAGADSADSKASK